MHGTKESFLNLHTPPARLNANEAAWYLGFKPHEVPMLVAAGLLTPLGRPARFPAPCHRRQQDSKGVLAIPLHFRARVTGGRAKALISSLLH